MNINNFIVTVPTKCQNRICQKEFILIVNRKKASEKKWSQGRQAAEKCPYCSHPNIIKGMYYGEEALTCAIKSENMNDLLERVKSISSTIEIKSEKANLSFVESTSDVTDQTCVPERRLPRQINRSEIIKGKKLFCPGCKSEMIQRRSYTGCKFLSCPKTSKHDTSGLHKETVYIVEDCSGGG